MKVDKRDREIGYSITLITCPRFVGSLVPPTEILPRDITSCRRLPEPMNGKRPDSSRCSITPAAHTSQALPYVRFVMTSGAM